MMALDVGERVNALVGADGDAGIDRRDLRHLAEIVRHHRLFEKVDTGALHAAHVFDGFRGAETLISVRRYNHAATEHLANGARALRILGRGVDADLDLEHGKTRSLLLGRLVEIALEAAAADHAEQRHAAAHFRPQQRMHRRAAGAAGNVVQRDFDRGLGAVIAVHAAVHRGQRAFDIGGIAAEQRGIEKMHRGDDALDRLAGHQRRRCRFAPTSQAAVGLDAHQHVVGAADFLARHDHRLEHRQADRDRFDGLDNHCRTPDFLMIRPPSWVDGGGRDAF